jgi:hypothetical protein
MVHNCTFSTQNTLLRSCALCTLSVLLVGYAYQTSFLVSSSKKFVPNLAFSMLGAALFRESWLPIIIFFYFSITLYKGFVSESGFGTEYITVPLVPAPVPQHCSKGQINLYLQLFFYYRLNWRATESISTVPSRPPPRRPSRIQKSGTGTLH